MKSDNAPWLAFWAVIAGIYVGWQIGVVLAIGAVICVLPRKGKS